MEKISSWNQESLTWHQENPKSFLIFTCIYQINFSIWSNLRPQRGWGKHFVFHQSLVGKFPRLQSCCRVGFAGRREVMSHVASWVNVSQPIHGLVKILISNLSKNMVIIFFDTSITHKIRAVTKHGYVTSGFLNRMIFQVRGDDGVSNVKKSGASRNLRTKILPFEGALHGRFLVRRWLVWMIKNGFGLALTVINPT